jgi:hypothetical protein
LEPVVLFLLLLEVKEVHPYLVVFLLPVGVLVQFLLLEATVVLEGVLVDLVGV